MAPAWTPALLTAIQLDADGGVTVDGEAVLRIDANGAIFARRNGPELEDEGLVVFDGPPATRRAVARLLVVQTLGASPPPPPPPPPTARGPR
jgi:hypothetical protein